MNEWTVEEWQQQTQTESLTAYYLYAPMCGTCAVASKMLDVVIQLLPDLPIGKANLNFTGSLPYDLQIESVPCLVITKEGKITNKVYAFQSVPYLYDLLKN
jgi:thioredoxin 1